MKNTPVALVLVALFSFPALAAAEENRPGFLKNKLWDGGKAEMTIYRATELRYGKPREAEVRLILVKEPWNDSLGVKSDRKSDRDVLKLNQILSVPTGTYRYEQMFSLFTDRASGRPVKFSYSHLDACGNTFKMGRFTADSLAFTWHTYWDGDGDGTRTLDWSDKTHLYEELPLLVRIWAADKPAFPYGFRLLNPQMNSRLGSPGTAAARAEVSTREGQFHFKVNHPGGSDLLVVDESFPHTLRSWTRADGSKLVIRKTLMLDYWNKNQPGDEKWLE